MKNILRAGLLCLVVVVSGEAKSCSQEQIGKMIINGVSQTQIDKICKKQHKVKKSNGDTIINIYNSPINTNTNTSTNTNTNTNNNSTSSSRSNDKNKRRGLYAGGYIGTAKANQNNNEIINNYGTQSTLELKDSKYLSGMIGYDFGNDIAIEYEKSSYDNELRSIMFSGLFEDYKGGVDVSAHFLSLNYTIADKYGFVPYIGLGVGEANIDIELKQTTGNDVIRHEDKLFAMIYNAGVDYYINKNIAVGFAMKGISYMGDAFQLGSDEEDDDAFIGDFDVSVFAMRLKIRF